MENKTNKELLILIEQATAGDKKALETVIPLGYSALLSTI